MEWDSEPMQWRPVIISVLACLAIFLAVRHYDNVKKEKMEVAEQQLKMIEVAKDSIRNSGYFDAGGKQLPVRAVKLMVQDHYATLSYDDSLYLSFYYKKVEEATQQGDGADYDYGLRASD